MSEIKAFLPIIYGSAAEPLEHSTAQDHTHRWKVYVRGIGNANLSPFIRKVTFKLHESFNSPLRSVDTFPFEINETGWGEFELQIRIYFCEPHDKSILLVHFLRLFPFSDTFSPVGSDSKRVICEKYDEIAFVQPSEYLKNSIEAFNAANPTLDIGEPLLWKAIGKETEKIKELIARLKEQTQRT